jgi:hypothetical protein
LCGGAGCVPMRGTIPQQTWHPEEPTAHCEPDTLGDTRGQSWSADARDALRDKLDDHEPVVVTALGCRVEVLERCNAPGAYTQIEDGHELEDGIVLAQELEGECDGATHVVRHASLGKAERVELAPLSLGELDLTGTWSGVMRQPNGPYEVYETSVELVQLGDRIIGVTRLTSIDEEYWGVLRFEGRLEGNTVFFADAEIIDDNLGFFLAWCTRGGYLIVDPRDQSLRGPWRADYCEPGTMDLERTDTIEVKRVPAVASVEAKRGS